MTLTPLMKGQLQPEAGEPGHGDAEYLAGKNSRCLAQQQQERECRCCGRGPGTSSPPPVAREHRQQDTHERQQNDEGKQHAATSPVVVWVMSTLTQWQGPAETGGQYIDFSSPIPTPSGKKSCLYIRSKILPQI